MKTFTNTIIVFAFAAMVAVIFSGCFNPVYNANNKANDMFSASPSYLENSEPVSDGALLELFLTDFPLKSKEVTAVRINITRVDIHSRQKGWQTILDSST